MRRDSRPRRRRTIVIALMIAVAVIASACEPVFFSAAVDHQSAMPDTRPWWCDSTGGGHGGHVMDPDPYEGIVKGQLSWHDCVINSALFDMANDYALQWPTAGEAEADGWFRVVPYAEGMGTHHRRADGANLDDVFRGFEPEFLMYDGNGPDARLTGMAWWVESEGGPPEGFLGDNDWWHQHPLVCLTPEGTWIGQNMTADACAAAGGVQHDFSDWWMVHAWITPPWHQHGDVFNNHHPCLPQSGPIFDPDHACWDEAMGGGHGH